MGLFRKLDQLIPLAAICLSLLLVINDTISNVMTWNDLHLLLHITGLRRRQCKGFVWKAEGHDKYSTVRNLLWSNIATSIYIVIILC